MGEHAAEPRPAPLGSGPLGLVLGGGGARAAYQAGVLRAIGRRLPELRIPIVTGVSAGAINAAYLAGSPDPMGRSAAELCRVWAGLRTEHVIEAGARPLLTNAARWAVRLASGGSRTAPRTRGLVDTSPLHDLLSDVLDASDGELTGVTRNIERGTLSAFAVTTTDYGTGRAVTWAQGRSVVPWDRPQRHCVTCALTVDHVMASAALPLFFPAVRIDGHWHGDGGIRQTAPLSPALHLGAERILAVSTRRRPLTASTRLAGWQDPEEDYPPPARILGILMNAIFLDALDYDATNLERINGLLDRLGTRAEDGLRRVELLTLRPSVDLAEIATEHERELPAAFRYLTRGWGTRDGRAQDSLAMLLFESGYTKRLMEIGERDAEMQGDAIARFLGASRLLAVDA